MKAHVLRAKESFEAQNRQSTFRGGRPPAAATPEPAHTPDSAPPPTLTDLPAVWAATRNYLAANARTLETIIGNSIRLDTLDLATNEAQITISTRFQNYTNDKAKAKLEEAFRTITQLPLHLSIQFIPDDTTPQGTDEPSRIGLANSPTPSAASQRLPPELIDEIKRQPLIQQLMTQLDATVTQIEILNTTEE